MKRLIAIISCITLSVLCTSCDSSKNIQPQVSQMKSICELSTLECYYHNVAKYKEEDASGILFWSKDKYFWIEYSGVVNIGIDETKVDLKISGEKVTVTLPEAKVLNSKVDESTLTKDSYIVDDDSANIEADDEINAYAQAQKCMEESAAKDTSLLTNAQQRAQTLLENYINNIGDILNVKYQIQWKYIKEK